MMGCPRRKFSWQMLHDPSGNSKLSMGIVRCCGIALKALDSVRDSVLLVRAVCVESSLL